MLLNSSQIALERTTVVCQLLATDNNQFTATSFISQEITPIIISNVAPLRVRWIKVLVGIWVHLLSYYTVTVEVQLHHNR